MKSVSESSAGRADILELETLSFAEMQAALRETTLDTAIVRGGFPELYANREIDHVAFYNSYLATYLERDVRSLANVGSLRDFERFLRACALRSANLLNKADLARDVGIARMARGLPCGRRCKGCRRTRGGRGNIRTGAGERRGCFAGWP